MTLEERIEAAIERNPGHTPAQIARNVRGSHVHDVLAVIGGTKGQPCPQTPTVASRKKTESDAATRTLADFRREHDQAWKIRDGLNRLFGGQVIMTDAEFREAVCGNPNRWRSAADQTEFKENRYRVGGEVLWASKETILEMRKIRGEAV